MDGLTKGLHKTKQKINRKSKLCHCASRIPGFENLKQKDLNSKSGENCNFVCVGERSRSEHVVENKFNKRNASKV